MANSARTLVEDVLSRDMTREIWSGNYDKALPVSVGEFELSAVLPAVFYMFRFGRRRGAGNFVKAFGAPQGTPSQRRRSTTIGRVAARLANCDDLDAFDGETERAVLGDLLLCFCLENVRRTQGREQQVQRVSPSHYMAAWIDLPESVAHLRYVPEMLVAVLANQREGDHVAPSNPWDRASHFPVGGDYENNVLLRAFSQGMDRRGEVRDDLASDRFDERDASVGLDQLLTVRLAQQLRTAPRKMRAAEGGGISNQRPIAERAARDFSDDVRRFVRSYADVVPRHALVDMLESCIAVGLSTILTSTAEILLEWADTGGIRDPGEQTPAGLFVDCSDGVDRALGLLAERSLDDSMRRMERIPVVLMALRLLDYEACANRRIQAQDISTRPYATEWLNLLGGVLQDRHPESDRLRYGIEHKLEKLTEKLDDDYPEVAEVLRDSDGQPNPVWRFAGGLMTLMGSKFLKHFREMVDSSFATGRPNGLATKRSTTRGAGVRRRRDTRRLVFTDSVLDYLVHLHLLPGGNGGSTASLLSFIEFTRERYGFHVDAAPPGMTISNEMLQRNRAILERRLRDLGLLVGVNDAERMKRLRPRFERDGGL